MLEAAVCREVIRKQCPAYLAKKRCWKFGRGCYCDEEMISRIIRGESLDVIKAPTRMSREGKPPCGRCYIYIEHQSHKFRMLSPLALPATLAGIFFGWPYYLQAFKVLDKAMDAVWKSLNFNPANLIHPATLVDVGDRPHRPDVVDNAVRVGDPHPMLLRAFTKITQPPPSGARSLQVRAPETAPTEVPWPIGRKSNSLVPPPSTTWGVMSGARNQATILRSGETASPKWRGMRVDTSPAPLTTSITGPASVPNSADHPAPHRGPGRTGCAAVRVWCRSARCITRSPPVRKLR